MKILLLLTLCFLSFISFNQESFEKIATIDRSLMDSKPFIVKNSKGYLFFNFGKKGIYLDQFDDKFETFTKNKLELPKEIRRPDYAEVEGNTLHLMKIIKPLTLIAYEINLADMSFKKTKTLPLGDPKAMNINYSSKWDFSFREDGSLLLTGNGGTDFDGNHFWRVSVFSINSEFNKVNWKHVLEDPEIIKKRAVTEFLRAKAVSEDEFEVYFVTGERGKYSGYKGYMAAYTHSEDGVSREIHEKSDGFARLKTKTAFDNGAGETFYFIAPRPIVQSGIINASIVDKDGTKIHRLNTPKKDHFRTTMSGKTHYILVGEGEVFVVHSEYAAGNTSTQIARWKF